MASWLIAGLGNPGAQYEQTRHNVGFWWIDQLAHDLGVTFANNARFHGQLATTTMTIGGDQSNKIYLLKPSVFMNRSGQSVAALANFYKIPEDHILVIHDELDLPVETVRLKRGGGHGGHNGLRDIIAQLGNKNFLRCRIGIGHPGNSRQVSDYVLSKPSQSDREAMMAGINASLAVLPDALSGDLEKAMNTLHTKD